jgi:hypothetical protein
MKSRTLIVISLFLALISASCDKVAGDDIRVTDVRTSVPFNGIRVTMDCDVSFVLSDTATRSDTLFQPDTVIVFHKKDSANYKVIIWTEDNLKGYIETPVINGKLVIRVREDKILRSYDRIRVEVRAPGLSYVEMTGPGSMIISLNDQVIRPFLDCTISNKATLNLRHIRYSYLKINMTGPGYAFSDSTGWVKTADLTTSSDGNISLFNIKADTVFATVKGAGDISVTVDSLLDGTISGSGNIWYQGVKPVIRSNITGTGQIIHL